MTGARWLGLLAGVLGASGVGLAAVGAHVVDAGDAGAARAWQSASLIHLVHAGTLLALSVAARRDGGRARVLAGWVMVLGVVLFCGSIYRAEWLGLDGAGPTAPLGGSLLILAWLLVSLAAWRDRP